MTQLISILATSHYGKKTTTITGKVVKTTDDRIYFRASRRSVNAAKTRVNLITGDYLDFASKVYPGLMAGIDYDGDLVGSVAR